MKTAELTGAMLDYWVARAEGVPAAELEIREVPRTDWKICVRVGYPMAGRDMALPYSTNWALAGPLALKWRDHEQLFGMNWNLIMTCSDPMMWICRAVVRAAFGDEVEDLPCA